MKESILHYIWQQKLFVAHQLKTTDNETVEVIDVGKYNLDAGPDFFNAKIKIGETLWAGNIEIHTQSTDWNKHKHNIDKAYDSVILHIVKVANKEIYRQNGEKIPQLELVYPEHIESNYFQLLRNKKWIPCENKLHEIPSIHIQSWKNSLLSERLEQKTNSISDKLNVSNQHWEEAFYFTLARNFGFGVNSQAFELLAMSLPLTVLGKHKDNLFQIEALLFGQSGLLIDNELDDYVLKLNDEYEFLRSKYGLIPIDKSQWKLLRLRPDNFPHVRIAQFSALIHTSTKLFSKILENPSIDFLEQIFKCEPSEYWQTHYVFGNISVQKSKKLGRGSIYGIIINTIAPFLFSYALKKNNQELKDKAICLLEQVPPENNSIVRGWNELGLKSETAFDSQALLQLKNQYCDEKKCLRCRIGHKVLSLTQI